jgi:hypothetical protein
VREATLTEGSRPPAPARAPIRVPGGTLRPLSRPWSAALGGAVGLVTAVFYFLGAGRPLDFDSSVTVGIFVKSRSILDPLKRQVALNNHPLFSVIEHVLWNLGLRSEAWLRVPPILFAVATVVIVTAWCAHFFGVVPALSAGAIVAANPMFAQLSRQLRGYSMLSFCAVASTLLLWRLVERSDRPIPRWVPVGFVLLTESGIGTHLYGVVVLIVHVGIVFARKEMSAKWYRRWFASAVLGGLVYLPTLHTVLHTRNQRTFYPSFPREVIVPLLGQAHVAVVALTLVVGYAVWMAHRRPSAVGGAFAMVLIFLFVWLVAQPQFLVFRYLVWLVPGVALAAAIAVARRPVIVVLVGIAVVAMIVHEVPYWTKTEAPTSALAAVVDAARSEHLTVCGVAHSGVGVIAYTPQPVRTKNIDTLAKCDVMVGLYVPHPVDVVERRVFPYSWRLHAAVAGVVYSKRPRAFIEAAMRRPRLTLRTHLRTWPK